MKVAINQKEFLVEKTEGKLTLNNKEVNLIYRQVSPFLYHVIYGGKSYEVLASPDSDSKNLKLQINGNTLAVQVTSDLELMLKEMGYDNARSQQSGPLKAPMPGLILDILVKEGDEVNQGDPLVILEAMKMENLIKASTQGVIGKIEVSKGDSVEKNQALISF